MFPLNTSVFPGDAKALADAIEESLRRAVSRPERMVTIEEDEYPRVKALRVNLDGATLRADPPRPVTGKAARKNALQVAQLAVAGRGVGLRSATVDLDLEASDVSFDQLTDDDGQTALVPASATKGSIEVGASTRELEAVIAQIAKAQAAKHGVTVEDVALTTRSRDSRSLDARVQLRARKLFLSAVIRITASLSIDDEMTAHISELVCDGEGAIGGLACSVLEPHLKKLNGRSFPMTALPLGGLRVEDVRITAGETLRVTARFGSG